MLAGSHEFPAEVSRSIGKEVVMQVAGDVFARFLVLEAEVAISLNAEPMLLTSTTVAWPKRQISIVCDKCPICRSLNNHEDVARPGDCHSCPVPVVVA